MAAPTVSNVFAPIRGYTGTSVTIHGTNFSGATAVKLVVSEPDGSAASGWSPIDAHSFTVVSATTITALVPHMWPPDTPGTPGAFIRWRVTTPDGTGTSPAGTLDPTPGYAGWFEYIGPVFESVTITPDPASVPADESVQLTATGNYLYDSSADLTRDVLAYWLSDDESVAMVNNGIWSGGLTLGRAPGSATITVSVLARGELGGPVVTDTVTLTVGEPAPPPPPPEGRFHLAFDVPSLTAYPTWTRLDAHPNLVVSYTIDRGRSYELDRTDTGRATVQIADPDGILDPTNPEGSYYGKLRPRMPAAICRYDPVAEEWNWRYRGFVESFDYELDPSQRFNRATISLVDLFEILSGAEMQPGLFGVTPPEESTGQVYFESDQLVENRIAAVLGNAGLLRPFRVVLTGSVRLHAAVYSPGESALAPIQEAADAEFPGVSNLYCDRAGRICFHGRLAKFYPDEVAAEWGSGAWDYHAWKAGDGAALLASPSDTVQLRELGFQRGLAKIINSASASPAGIEDSQIAGQLVIDTDSIAAYGPHSWSADNLLTKVSLLDGSNDLTETKRFAAYYCANYAQARDRISAIGFRSLHPDDPRAPALWQFLSLVDIADSIEVSVASPGGGGFDSEQFFVEGIHEEARPLDPGYDDVTLRLDLSPRAFFASNPWPSP